MTARAWWHRLLSLLAILSLACSLWAAGLVICPKCGTEAEANATVCPHCGALLPIIKVEATVPTNVTAAVDTRVTTISDMALEAARMDKRLADESLTNNHPAVSYAYYANAVALSRLIKREGMFAGTGKSLAESMERCRNLLAYATRICPTCNGSGVRSMQIQTLGGDKSAPGGLSIPLESATCPTCGGRGVVSTGRSANETRVLIAQGWRDFETRQQAFGRIASGRVWVPPDLLTLLDVKAQALIRAACPTPCPGCMGIGVQDCSHCKGAGRLKCNNEGCVNGWIIRKDSNTPAPKAAVRLEVIHRERCSVCQGTGFMPCPDCQGLGTSPCKTCNGTGRNPVCQECGGQGWEACPKCQGTGNVGSTTCPICHGEKALLCPKCHGEGCSTR